MRKQTQVSLDTIENYCQVQPEHFPPLPENWVSECEMLPNSDSALQLFSVTHHQKEWTNHKALIISHGMSDHGGRYLHFPHYLQSEVGAVHCVDHQGNGRSEGLRGHVDQFDFYADDLALNITRFHERLQKKFGKAEIHLLGHSMGGLIVLNLLLRYPNLPLASVTLSAPYIKLKIYHSWPKRKAAILMAHVWDRFHLNAAIDNRTLSHDPAVVRATDNDPLAHNKSTPGTYVEVLKFQSQLVHSKELKYPVQFQVPIQDEVVDPEATLHYYNNLKAPEKSLKTYPGFYHESFNELGKEKFFADLRSWIHAHPVK